MTVNVTNKLALQAFAIIAVLTMVASMLPTQAFAVSVGTVPACTLEVVSDTTTLADGDSSVETWEHPVWLNENTLNAEWIWNADNQTPVTPIEETVEFTKTFIFNGTLDTAVLKIASDNGYKVVLNGDEIEDNLSDTGASHHGSAETFTVTDSIIANGENTLVITVTNFAGGADSHENPAGLLYNLTMSGGETTDPGCNEIPADDTTITITKVTNTESAETFDFYLDGSETPVDSLAGGESTEAIVVEPGSHNISEGSIDGWTLTNISCVDELEAEVGSFDGVMYLELEAGDDITCTFTNTQDGDSEPVVPACIDDNLLLNGSFEIEVAEGEGSGAHGGGLYEVFASITNWTSTAGFEVWNNVFGGGSDGEQNLELAVNDATTISQTIDTVIGNEYKVTYDFAARPDSGSLAENELNVLINDTVVDTVSGEDIDGGVTDWGSYSYVFTATGASTKISFADAGTSNGVGTLFDNAGVCLTDDNTVVEPDRYEIYGFVWDDTDEDDNFEEGEQDLEGWTVTATNVKTEEVIEDVTDASGRYSLYVPAGTWIIREIEQEGWDQLSTADGDGTYTVTVPTVVDMEVSVSFPLNLFFSVAHAADIPTYVGPKNFGNNFVGTPNNGNSGGNGRKIELTNDNNDREGEVEGDSTSNEPDGEVLGAATSTLPVGAPATGAGGTSPVSISLPTLTAIMTSRTAYSRTKNG